MKYALVFWLICLSTVQAQDKILVFTKTNGFTHPSIGAGVAMITNEGISQGLWETDTTEDSSVFTTDNLAQYKAVIFCNTSGNNLLNDAQQLAFENFITNGGGFLGVHAATDTYRNGSWPFYNELVGGIVQSGPNHTSNNFNATMTVLNSHPAVDFLDGSWNKDEEYYYWELNGGYLYPENINLLEVEATGDETYDAARPMAWYKEYEGGRSFYTALGHNSDDYTNEQNFIAHVTEGIKYVMGLTLGVGKNFNSLTIPSYPNPVSDVLHLDVAENSSITEIFVYNSTGNLIERFSGKTPVAGKLSLDISGYSSGIYFLRIQMPGQAKTLKIIKK